MTIFYTAITVFGIYALICGLLFLFQEKILFVPKKLDKEYRFGSGENIEELNIASSDGVILNGVLAKAKNPKGLIFYLHGNADYLGLLHEVADFFTALDYDIFLLDYRGYGKSEGAISSEEQLFHDNQIVYDTLKKRYTEDTIIISGYSIGTALATKLASENHPRLLILQAPYYSMVDLMKRRFPFVPTFLLRYPLTTYVYLKQCTMPVVMFHGTEDQTTYHDSSLKLEKEFKSEDRFITLEGHGHANLVDNPDYRREIAKILG